jgi:hypothetical protein
MDNFLKFILANLLENSQNINGYPNAVGIKADIETDLKYI